MLEAASAGYLGVDHRLLRAILHRSEEAIPDLVRFASEPREEDRVNLDDLLLDLFHQLRAPAGLPFLIELIRRDPLDIDDDLVEALANFGPAAVDPLLELLQEMGRGDEAGDVPFLLTQLRVRDSRIFDELIGRLERGDQDAALYLDMYGDPAAIPALEAASERLPPDDIERPRIHGFIKHLAGQHRDPEVRDEPFDIWRLYSKKETGPFDLLPNRDRLALLDSESAEVRLAAASASRGEDAQDEKIRARLLQIAKTDPDVNVRGECWELLEELSREPEVRRALTAVLTDSNAPLEERGGAAVALAQHSDDRKIFQAIEELYRDPRSRAKALKAMGRSFDKRFAAYPAPHLDDPDSEIKKQAIWAVGYMNLSGEASRLVPFFDIEQFRADALFAYALCAPGETSKAYVRSLMHKIDDLAGGFKVDEEELVEVALDQRLVLHGKDPVFSDEAEDDESDDAPAVSRKVGRNDPCPCGSGKKYKKCCGA